MSNENGPRGLASIVGMVGVAAAALAEEKRGEPPEPPPVPLAQFLAEVPPGRPQRVSVDMSWEDIRMQSFSVKLPEIRLHCANKECNGPRIFLPIDGNEWRAWKGSAAHLQFLVYRCRNCMGAVKRFALFASFPQDISENVVEVRKLGELPSFGPPTPGRLLTLLDNEKDYFVKGRNAENQGMGIAAFAYYRRVVENKKAEIIDRIIQVARTIHASSEMIQDLQRAKNETQFSKAIAEIKHGIPQALLIKGHNPLTLLHNALSDGLHGQDDGHCLELASSIRVVLVELVERMAAALKEDKDLTEAVSKLIHLKDNKGAQGPEGK